MQETGLPVMTRPSGIYKEFIAVQQVKLFKGIESEIDSLEAQINEWLTANSAVRVISMTGNIAPQTIMREQTSDRRFGPSDILLAVLYETG